MGKFGIIVDSKHKVYGFEIKDKDDFFRYQFVTFYGEGSIVFEVSHLESYPLSCRYRKEASYIQEGGGSMYPCFMVDHKGNRYNLDGAEGYVVNRLLMGVPIVPEPFKEPTVEEYENEVKELLNSVEYVSLHMNEIADSYNVTYETRHLTKVGGDDRFYVERIASIEYTDCYLSLFFKPSETLYEDRGYTSHFEIPDEVHEEMKYTAEDAKLAFFQNYNKVNHAATLLYQRECIISQQREKCARELLTFNALWSWKQYNPCTNSYNSGVNSRRILQENVGTIEELEKIITNFNDKLVPNCMGNVFEDK